MTTRGEEAPWWDGSRWVYAVSADGRWIFDGYRWTPRVASAREHLPRSLRAWRVLWMLVWGGWVPAAVVILLATTHSSPGQSAVVLVLALLGGTGMVATIGWGVALGMRKLWKQLGWSIALGTGALLAGYIVGMAILDSSRPAPGADDAAAVGALMGVIPVAVSVTAALASGVLIARISQATARRRLRC